MVALNEDEVRWSRRAGRESGSLDVGWCLMYPGKPAFSNKETALKTLSGAATEAKWYLWVER